MYRFRHITAKTRLFGIVGYPLTTTFSPRIFNAVFNHEKIDAVYLPFPADTLEAFLNLAEELKIAGAAVTIPYKEAILPYLRDGSEEVRTVGACNTIVFDGNGWKGYNTDTLGFSASLLEFIGRKNLRRRGVTIIGAGGAARAVAAEIYRLKGRALILNRNSFRAREIALPYRFHWGGLDGEGVDLIDRYSDIIIQTTPVGMEPNIQDDPFELYHFTGREVVMDIIYKPERTAFLKRAAEAGCPVLNGYDMLIRQAKQQYRLMLGMDFPDQLLSRIRF
jgi:3-dehydroquinate dehydratase/shikimate dehydrogenase